MSIPKFPVTVQVGHTTVKIYKTPSNGCDQFTVAYYLGDKRQRRAFSDYGLALTEAQTVASKLSAGELNVLTLKNEDRLSYVRAMQALQPTGVTIEMAALHFAEAFRILGGTKVVEAAQFYLKHHPSNLPCKSVGEVVEELIAAKEADQLSDVYLKDLRGRLGRFKEAFPMQISLVTTAEIDRFLRELKVEERLPGGGVRQKLASPKSRNHYRAAIGTLFYFAEARGYVPKGLVDIESLALAKQRDGEIEIFRPEELARVLASANPALIPFLAIGAFAGLRHAEIQRLDWSEVRLDDGFIEIKAGKAKTASRRLVPIQENLKFWLLPYRKSHGPVTAYANMSKQLMWLAEEVNAKWRAENPAASFTWKHNALRHSFISYRVAQTQNVAQVALEAGNSPRVVFGNYRELVRPADAVKWFAIAPEQPANVMPLVKTA